MKTHAKGNAGTVMKRFASIVSQRPLQISVAVLSLLAGAAQVARADAIPYPTSGVVNPVTYTFTAVANGNITAYFAGSTASYDNELGLLVNGASTGIVGLDNHTSALGASLNLGNVSAGDTLTFVLVSHTLGMNAYSDPALNVGYDLNGTVGHNHVYATPYTATSPIIDSIPVGTFVSFEDLQFPNSDFNYNDEDFVFVNVGVTTRSLPDAASSATLLSISLAGLGLLRRRLCR
jgi:hypothetical protein